MPQRPAQRPSYNESAVLHASGHSLEIKTDGGLGSLIAQTYSASQSANILENASLIKKKYHTIQSIIGHPICCGYLMKFCMKECNAESLNFVLEVDELRDSFVPDNDSWHLGWKELDKMVMTHEKLVGLRSNQGVTDFGDTANTSGKILNEGIWASVTDKTAAITKANEIVNKYLSHDSLTQVCISEIFIKRTMKRLGLIHLYGPEVFEEACIEPIKTMKKDILPRFLVSDIAARMVFNVASCEPHTPPASDLIVPPPKSRLLTITSLESFRADKKFNLDEVVNCLQLYNEFYAYLKKCQSSENLICVRMILIFEELMETLNLMAGGLQAWKIYQYFVAPGGAYEVSIHCSHRKLIMLGMALPKKGLFNNLYRSAYEMLKVNFRTFSRTSEYAGLGKVMRDHKIELDRVQRLANSSALGCFGFGGGVILNDNTGSEYSDYRK